MVKNMNITFFIFFICTSVNTLTQNNNTHQRGVLFPLLIKSNFKYNIFIIIQITYTHVRKFTSFPNIQIDKTLMIPIFYAVFNSFGRYSSDTYLVQLSELKRIEEGNIKSISQEIIRLNYS